MEDNICDVNQLDADVLLPPRKRLLAGFKKQSSYGNGASNPSTVASSSSSNEFDSHLNKLLISHVNDPNLTNEEIAQQSRANAIGTVKAAKAARAIADEKAMIAAKAVAAAKKALDLVASFTDEPICYEPNLKKNKMKKHVPVQLLYSKRKHSQSTTNDEELARTLHRAINSSPRILKTPSSSDNTAHKHKKLKTSPAYEKDRVLSYKCNGADDSVNGDVGAGSSSHEVAPRSVLLEFGSAEADSSHAKEKTLEATSVRKRGRVKLKKLPLSSFNAADQMNPMPDMNGKSSVAQGDGVIPVEGSTGWKCQELKTPECMKQNKVMQP